MTQQVSRLSRPVMGAMAAGWPTANPPPSAQRRNLAASRQPAPAVMAALALLLASLWPIAQAHAQAYIGFAHPAGGQQGTTFQATLGGQSIPGADEILISGTGVTGRVIEYNKRMNPQEIQLLREQLAVLQTLPAQERDGAITNMMRRIQTLIENYVQQPQSSAIANLVVAEITIARDAPPGEREIRVGTPRGISNPLPFHVGQLPEITSPPIPTSHQQILGNEAQSLRRRQTSPAASTGNMMDMMEMMQMATSSGGPTGQSDVDDDEVTIRLPCVINGQIASGTVDRFRFKARRGQRIVAHVKARSLIPYLADAVPGWFQAVLTLCDDQGREIAYNDDFRFKPDPVLFVQIPRDGDYILVIHDALFRGREDFVYRMTVGEIPFVTSMFPLGAQATVSAAVELTGINLAENQLFPPTDQAEPGIRWLMARGRGGLLSNPMPFAIDTLPCGLEREPNTTLKQAQRVALPLIVNGTIGTPGDRDLFTFQGRQGQAVVAEVYARRLDSPVDALLVITDAAGRTLAMNDDQEDIASGLNTHHADSRISLTLPGDGIYTVHLSDAQHAGGQTFAYRLRLSEPQPDFELRVVPSRAMMRSKESATVSVHAIRRDGFDAPIRLELKNPPEGFAMPSVTLSGTQTVARVTLRTSLTETDPPVALTIQGVATNGNAVIARAAVPAEDRMQAFLWRHLSPAQEFLAMVFDPKTPAEDPRPHKRPVRVTAAATPPPRTQQP